MGFADWYMYYMPNFEDDWYEWTYIDDVEVLLIKSPNVLEEARIHFDCDDIEYL